MFAPRGLFKVYSSKFAQHVCLVALALGLGRVKGSVDICFKPFSKGFSPYVKETNHACRHIADYEILRG